MMMKENVRWFNRARIMTFLLLPFLAQCQSKTQNAQGLDVDKPEVVRLSNKLKEISGITFKDNKLYAITDNTGSLFQLNPANGNILAEWPFGKIDDYEDVTVAGDKFFVLNSNGDINSFFIEDGKNTDVKTFKFPFGKGNEFEILYYDESRKNLIMICKQCKDDKKNKLTVYSIDPTSGKYMPAGFEVDAKEVAEKNNAKTERLKPSAAAVHPQTGEIYMVSSINKMLIRLSPNGQVLSVRSLKRSLFEQPEGIAITAGGDLIISSEAGKKENATLLFLKASNK